MIDLKQRSTLPEKMDEPGVPAAEIKKAVHELGLVNKFLGGYNVIIDALEKINLNGKPKKILDIGSGGGDVLREISGWAKRKNKNVELTGIDRNPLMTSYASNTSSAYSNITFKTFNVWDEQLKNEKYDIVINNLFCHHFDDDELVKLVKLMNELSSGHIIINDIQRHWFAYYSIKYITGLFSKTYLVKYDAPLSVARSLTKNEWKTILHKAGIRNYSIEWKWAFRWQIIISKNAG